MRLDSVEVVVLDEADRMLDMGFIRDVRRIISLSAQGPADPAFSATMPSDISGLANSILRDPVRVAVTPEKPTVDLIEQKVAFVEKAEKRAFLAALINAQGDERAIVFTRTKHGADRLAQLPDRRRHRRRGDPREQEPEQQDPDMDGFRAGSLRVLVATDLAARGIDVDGISHVYNYELPEVPETYVHRIGRTARAGASGCAIALCDREEKPLLKAIEKLLRTSVPLATGPLFERAAEEGRKATIAELPPRAPIPVSSDATAMSTRGPGPAVDPRGAPRAGARAPARAEPPRGGAV